MVFIQAITMPMTPFALRLRIKHIRVDYVVPTETGHPANLNIANFGAML